MNCSPISLLYYETLVFILLLLNLNRKILDVLQIPVLYGFKALKQFRHGRGMSALGGTEYS